MNEYEFNNRILPKLEARWKKQVAELNNELVLDWRNALARFDVGAVEVAVRTYGESPSARFFPRPGQIAEICGKGMPSDRGAPRDRVDYDALNLLRDEIAQEEADDAVTLSSVSDDAFAQYLNELITADPALSHLKGKPRTDRMAQVFVCDRVREQANERN